MVFSAFLLGYAAFQVPAGWLAARVGPRKLLTWALVWWGIFSVATALVPPGMQNAIVMLALVRFALGIGESAVYPASNQFISRLVPAEERGKANGLIFAGVGAGSGLTPPLISAVVVFAGWRASFFVCAAIGLVVALIWYMMARDRPQDHARVNADELAHIEAGLPPEPSGERLATPWRAILSSRNVWGLFMSYFAFGYVVWIFFSWFFIYLTEVRGLDVASSALFGMAPFVAMTVGCLAGGVLNDAIAKRFGLAAVQLHGQETSAQCEELNEAGLLVMKAFSVGQVVDFAALLPYVPYCDFFLFDTKGAAPGGNGAIFDWNLLSGYNLPVPYFLAGGLGLEHAAELAVLRLPGLVGVDLNSGFETAPGVKDAGRLAQMLTQLHLSAPVL